MWLIEASSVLSPLLFTSAVSFTSVSSQGMSSILLIFLYLFDFWGVLGFSVEEVGPRVVQAPSSQFCASVSVRGGLDPYSYCLQSTANFSELCAPALCDPALIGSVWLSRSGSFVQFCCGLVFGCTELYGVIYSFG